MNRSISNDMIKIVEQWANSDKSQKDFLKENNITIHKFYYWLKKYRELSSPGGFVPLRLTKNRNSITQIEIEYPNGTKIHLPSTTNLSVIRQLIMI